MRETILELVHSTWFVLLIGIPIAIAAVIGIVGEILNRNQRK